MVKNSLSSKNQLYPLDSFGTAQFTCESHKTCQSTAKSNNNVAETYSTFLLYPHEQKSRRDTDPQFWDNSPICCTLTMAETVPMQSGISVYPAIWPQFTSYGATSLAVMAVCSAVQYPLTLSLLYFWVPQVPTLPFIMQSN